MYNKVIQAGDYLEIYSYQFDMNIVDYDRKERTKYKNPVRTPENARILKNRFIRLCRAGVAKERGQPHFISLTYANSQVKHLESFTKKKWYDFLTDIREKNETQNIDCAYEMFRLFIQRIRNRYPNFSYIAVPEFQKDTKNVHFHILAWYLPIDIHIKERVDRKIAKIWSHGFVDVKLTWGDTKLPFYLSKYMNKALTDPRLYGKKAYTKDRKFPTYTELSTKIDISLIIEYMQFENAEVLKEKTFDTEYIGEVSYILLYNP